MRLAITILSPIIYVFVSLMTLAICSSSHIINTPQEKWYHLPVIVLELLLYYFAFAFTRRSGETTRGLIITLLVILISFDSAWRMLTFNYGFIPVHLDILPHYIFMDLVPLYFILVITWITKRKEPIEPVKS